MKISVVIVNYNVKHYVEQCVHSVWRATRGLEAEILVVDNHSKDGSVSYLRQRLTARHDHLAPVTVIDSNHNLGFARGNNIAICQAKGEYVLLLNPDTFLGEDVLHKALDFMDSHPEAGGVGVRMHNADGSLARESRRAIPTPLVSLKKMLGNSRQYYMSHLPWDCPSQIEIISGAFCLMRRKALDQVGLLDEDFFMYGEDIDLSYRLLKGGWQNWYLPCDMVHYKGESTQKSSFRYVHVFYQAMHIFFRKHYGHLSKLITLPITAAIYVRASIALCQMFYYRTRCSLGFYDKYSQQPDYLFMGSREMLTQTRQLSLRKGLRAVFLEADALDLSNIAAGTCVVCDTGTFSFADIITAFASRQDHDLVMGTYSSETGVVITPTEVIS